MSYLNENNTDRCKNFFCYFLRLDQNKRVYVAVIFVTKISRKVGTTHETESVLYVSHQSLILDIVVKKRAIKKRSFILI